MKIAAFSDVHSNIFALEAVLEDIKKLGNDVQVVVAGDFLNVGPFPRETLARIRALAGAVVIAGNHEEYILENWEAMKRGPLLPPHRVLFAPSAWTARQLTQDDIDWLIALPRQAQLGGGDKPKVSIVHGSPRRQIEGIFPKLSETRLAEIFAGHIEPKQLWISGHTHLPACYRWQDMTITSNGSVGLSLDGDWRASYLLAEWDERVGDWQIEHRRVAFDHERAVAALLANAAYDQGGPFMRFMWYNLKHARYSGVTEFGMQYRALGHYPTPPDDFPHFEKLVEAHLAKLS